MANHYWWAVFTQDGFSDSGPAGMLLFNFLLYFAFVVAKKPISYLMGCCCKFLMLDEIEINEDIDKYTNCLDDDDKQWTV